MEVCVDERLANLRGEASIPQLARREIQRQVPRSEAGIQPRTELLAGMRKQPGPDRTDHSRFFGERNELVWPNWTQIRVVPANKRFQTDLRTA